MLATLQYIFYIGGGVHLLNFQPYIMVCETDLISRLPFHGMTGISCVQGNRKGVYLYDCIVTYSGYDKTRQRCELFAAHAFYNSPKRYSSNYWYVSCRELCSSSLLGPSSRLVFQEGSTTWAPVKSSTLHAEIFTFFRTVILFQMR